MHCSQLDEDDDSRDILKFKKTALRRQVYTLQVQVNAKQLLAQRSTEVSRLAHLFLGQLHPPELFSLSKLLCIAACLDREFY